jgi:hypothetical protein
MKNILLLLTIILTCTTAHAQKIDKKLLTGRWDLYTMSMAGRSLCRDSVAETIQSLIRSRRADDPTLQLTPADSIALIDAAKAKLADMFQTFLTFDGNGNTKVLIGFDKHESGEMAEQTGTYQWSGENKIIQKLGKANPDIFIIISLTTTKLVITPEDESRDMALTFIRAK